MEVRKWIGALLLIVAHPAIGCAAAGFLMGILAIALFGIIRLHE